LDDGNVQRVTDPKCDITSTLSYVTKNIWVLSFNLLFPTGDLEQNTEHLTWLKVHNFSNVYNSRGS